MSAPESQKAPKRAGTKSGVFTLSSVEPESHREPPPPQPKTLPESKIEVGATTGIMPIVSEGTDDSAVGDADDLRGDN